MQPTYRLLIGIPGKSNAFAISRRLGLVRRIIIQEARRPRGQKCTVDFEDVLSTARCSSVKQMERARLEAEQLRLEMQKTKQKSEAYYEEIQKQREKAAEQARKEAQRIIDDARATANRVQEELKQMRKQLKLTADAQESQREAGSAATQPQRGGGKLSASGVRQTARPKPSRQIREGDTVELLKLGSKATVLKINKDGSLQLQAGIMKLTAKPEEVYLLEDYQKTEVKKFIEKTTRQLRNVAASPELDLRGMASDEAIAVLNIFLDNAMMANLHQVRIIHGKGTGVLRKAVHDEVKRNGR